MSAASLEADLRALGYDCRVEALERVAVITLSSEISDPVPSELRKDALRVAPTHGFTHVALEVPGGPTFDAALPGA